MFSKDEILDILSEVDPGQLSYQDWLLCGMALKYEGFSVDTWDEWSQQDYGRYHPGECEKKWDTFNGSMMKDVTAGTIVQYARDQGWTPERREKGHALSWDAEIGRDYKLIDKNWIEGMEISEPQKWEPEKEVIRYLETLFQPEEFVGYCVNSAEDEDGKWKPVSSGNYTRTAGELISALKKVKSHDIGAVLGDYNTAAGAWIRFNPLDGRGVKNENVASFRYALVESDTLDLEKQNAIVRELELPIAVLMYSGGKSLHAIVRIDAANFEEYRNRVDYLYKVCEKNGLRIDTQNRNPSRLSRLPGVIRKDKKQFIIDTNIGMPDFKSWKEHIEDLNDDLPDPEKLDEIWNDMPDLAPCLIDGVLRQGHKMLLAGPSKAGKSFLQIQLCVAIAEGLPWLGFPCAQGRVMYVNLELDRASCLHRFKDVYTAMGIEPKNVGNIDIWNLRGKSMPMDRLAPKLIRRAQKKNYIAVIIDPIYKVITGDENSADQMANFCNQFDKVCTELGVATIYCHHHSKGAQGGKKAMDRASGSGVFARDPDALLDIIELPITDQIASQERQNAVRAACFEYMDKYMPKVAERLTEQIKASYGNLTEWIAKTDELTGAQRQALIRLMDITAEETLPEGSQISAWRIEGTLREFPSFAPVNVWFDWPIHRLDRFGTLKNAMPEDDSNWYRGRNGELKPKKTQEERDEKKLNDLDKAFEVLSDNGRPVKIGDIANYLGKDKKTVRRYAALDEAYEVLGGYIYCNEDDEEDEDDR